LTSVDWGVLEPKSVKNVTVYVKNTSNLPAALSLQTGNWSPTAAATYITLSWDYKDVVLGAGEVRTIKLSLSISTTITGITSFSFDITIAATG